MSANKQKSTRSRRQILQGVACGSAATFLSSPLQANDLVERADLVSVFQSQGVVGTFAVFNSATGQMTVVDAKRAAVRYVPASTFKIANSLIALETGVVKDENEVIPYGGKPQDIKSWEKDMSMRDAIPISNVPIYQELARRIGLQTYATWLTKLDYGNRETGTALERFWLDGPLGTSAIEQCRFVDRLALGNLPMSDRSQTLVRDILKLESKDGRTLYGKTGWSQKIGWWTGWVDDKRKITSFALNMDMPSVQDAPKRVAIAKTLLGQLGVL
jgi:beta-lactamase class D